MTNNADLAPEAYFWLYRGLCRYATPRPPSLEVFKSVAHDMIASLPAHQRVCIELFYRDGKSVAEIAQAPGCDTATFWMHHEAAIAALRQVFQKFRAEAEAVSPRAKAWNRMIGATPSSPANPSAEN